MKVHRDPDVEKYKNSMQFIIDGWAAVRVASVMADETGMIGTKSQFQEVIEEYISSDPELHIRDFGYMYILLKRKGWPEEIIEDISKYFERGALLSDLCKAYEVRG